MRWEAIAVNADFWSQVLQSRSLKPLDFALGAVIALKRQALRDAGGFAPLVNQLADDYQLGRLVSRAGWRITLCPVTVECREAPRGWRGIWAHQVRWTRTIRVCQPAPYFFSILANATLWPVMWLVLCPGFHTLATVTALLLGRIVIALDLQRRFTRRAEADADWWLVPVKDLRGAVLWAWAFCGNEIVWRGERYRVRSDGTMA
jgi:ceramide glucosyltransferase